VNWFGRLNRDPFFYEEDEMLKELEKFFDEFKR
jgi:hypothetical protein